MTSRYHEYETIKDCRRLAAEFIMPPVADIIMSQSQREDVHHATMFQAPAGATLTLPCRRLSATATLPRYAHEGDAGADLYSDEDTEIYALTSKLVKTNFTAEIPPGYVGLCCSRSGLALRHEVIVLNAPGIVDASYRGPYNVILANFGASTFPVKRGDRIAQLVIVPFAICRWFETERSDATTRGSNGFGSTG